MKKLMNKKILAGILATGALLASGAASATSCTSLATVGAWAASPTQSCTDTDGDMTFTYGSSSIPNTLGGSDTGLSVSEHEISGNDYYNLGLDWNNGYSGGGNLVYSVSPIGNNPSVRGVNFDTVVIGTTSATKVLSDSAGNALLTLTSTNGSNVPETPLPAYTGALTVTDTFASTIGTNGVTNGTFLHADNSFVVPEPGSLLLLGIGLTALVIGRQKVLMGAV